VRKGYYFEEDFLVPFYEMTGAQEERKGGRGKMRERIQMASEKEKGGSAS
jgi:hypothetical protein